jgi:hypothetical protein
MERDKIIRLVGEIRERLDQLDDLVRTEEATGSNDQVEVDDPEEHPCPGCRCRPGEGVTDGCMHPDGCGYWKALYAEVRA